MLKAWNTFNTTMKAVAVLYGITFVHHIYGGIIYGSMERIIMAFVFTAVFLLTVWLYRRYTKLWAKRAFWSLVIVFWIVMIGIYEGGYNHTLYLLLWFTDSGSQLISALYPAGGDVKVPNSFIFEGTGVLTFLGAMALAVIAAQSKYRKVKGVNGVR